MKLKCQGNLVSQDRIKAYIDYLSDISNIQTLMPASKVEDFRVVDQGCMFRLQGLTDFGMKIMSKSDTGIIFTSITDKAFTLELDTIQKEENVIPQLTFHIEVAKLMEIALKTPLTNVFNHFLQQLEAQA